MNPERILAWATVLNFTPGVYDSEEGRECMFQMQAVAWLLQTGNDVNISSRLGGWLRYIESLHYDQRSPLSHIAAEIRNELHKLSGDE